MTWTFVLVVESIAVMLSLSDTSTCTALATIASGCEGLQCPTFRSGAKQWV
jgi:hypothetical protein